MSAWAAAAFSLVGVAVGGIVSLIAVELQARHAATAQTAAEAARLRELGAAKLGPISGLLSDSDPDRLAMNAGPESLQAIADRWNQWLELRDALASYALGHPDAEFGYASERLIVAVSNSQNSGGWLVRDLLERTGGNLADARATARSDHSLALQLLQIVAAGARGTVTGGELRSAVSSAETDAEARAEADGSVASEA